MLRLATKILKHHLKIDHDPDFSYFFYFIHSVVFGDTDRSLK